MYPFTEMVYCTILLMLLPQVSMCPIYCECVGSIFMCICPTEKHAISFGTKKTSNNITFENCQELTVVRRRVDAYRRMNNLKFSNMDTLIIEDFAFAAFDIENQLLIEDVKHLYLTAKAFDGLLRVGELDIRSVNMTDVHDFGGMYNIGNITISNCNIRKLESSAFKMENVTSFAIISSIIGDVTSQSVDLVNVGDISLSRTRIDHIHHKGFLIRGSDSLRLQHCKLGSVSPGAFDTKYVDEVVFQNCAIAELGPTAFGRLTAETNLTFSGNKIEIARLNSFLDHNSATVDMRKFGGYFTFEDNAFRCDCEIAWMWQQHSLYQTALSTSYCIEDPNVPLSSLTPIFEDNGECKSMEHSGSSDTSASLDIDAILLICISLIYNL